LGNISNFELEVFNTSMTAETKLFVVVGLVKNRPYNLAIASEKIRR